MHSKEKRQEELIRRLHKAYQCISDILPYAPEFMHSTPKTDYSKALSKAQIWLNQQYGQETKKGIPFNKISNLDDEIL